MFSRKVAIVLVAGIVMRLMAVATGALTARFLGPSGKGMLTALVTVVGIAMLLLSLGVNSANIFFTGRDKQPKEVLLGNSVAFWAVAGLTGFSAIYFGRGLIGRVIPAGCEDQFWWLLIGLVFVLTLGSGLIGGILLGEQKFLKTSISALTQAGIYLLLLIIFLPIFHMGLGGVLLASLLGLLASAALNWYFVREGPGRQPLRVSIPALGETIRYGLKGQIGNIMQWGNYRLDVFIVAYFLTAADLGWYAVAFTVAELIWIIPGAVATVLFPTTAKGGNKEANRVTPLVFRHTMMLIVLSCLVSAGSARFLIPLVFGQEFSPSVTPFWLLLPGVAALGLSKVLAGDLSGRGFPHYCTYATAVAFIVAIAGDLTLIPRLGIAGAAIASSLSYVTLTLLMLVVFFKVSKVSITSLFLVKAEDALVWKRYVLALLHISKDGPD